MAKHLTQRLIHLCGFGLAAECVAKLRFDHVERGFDVAALVVLLHEPFVVVAVVVIETTPQSALAFPLRL